VLTLWAAGDGWRSGESKFARYPLVRVDVRRLGRSQLTLGGSPLGSPYEVGCAMAAVIKRIEGGNVHVIDASQALAAYRRK
jgi:hypothetical protein